LSTNSSTALPLGGWIEKSRAHPRDGARNRLRRRA
jgi:hypothetical protein